MARLNDSDITRLLGGLGSQPPAAHAAPEHVALESETPHELVATPHDASTDEIEHLRSSLAGIARDGGLRDALESALREYVQRDVTCTVSDDATSGAEALRFEGGEPLEWHLDVDGQLAAALGDVMIGGDGSNTRHTNRRRLGRLIEPLATRLVAIIARAADREPPRLRFIETPRRAATLLVGGSIEVGATKAGWTSSAALRNARSLAAATTANVISTGTAPASAPRAAAPTRTAPYPEPRPASAKAARDIVHPVIEPGTSDARQQGPASGRERVIPKHSESDGAFAGAVAAACSRLGEITRCVTAADPIVVTRVEAPSLSRDDLKLALIAGGQGSLVLSADREAVTSVAAATLGAHVPASGKPGAVVVDAVEAVLRAALRGFAENLPGIAGGPQRFVRLAEGALPARSPHYAIAAPLHIGERAATLQWLVPAWMATAKGEERAPSDGR
jgi:hypothetical protein